MKVFTFPNLWATISLLSFITPARAEAAISQAQIEHQFGIYGKAWGEPNAGARDALLAQVWAKDGQYKDPSVALTGAAALSQHIGGFLQQFPGARFTLTSRLDFYGTTFRANWLLDFGDGKTPALEGFDYGELDAEGRIAKITGFFGSLPKTETVQNEAIVGRFLEALFTKFDYAALDRILFPAVVYKQAVGLPMAARLSVCPRR